MLLVTFFIVSIFVAQVLFYKYNKNLFTQVLASVSTYHIFLISFRVANLLIVYLIFISEFWACLWSVCYIELFCTIKNKLFYSAFFILLLYLFKLKVMEYKLIRFLLVNFLLFFLAIIKFEPKVTPINKNYIYIYI